MMRSIDNDNAKPHLHSSHPSTQPTLPTSAQLLKAIEKQNAIDVARLLHYESALTTDERHAVFEKAWQHTGCLIEIKEKLLQYLPVDRQFVLDLAVRHDDFSLAKEILKQGAAPQSHDFYNGSTGMRSLLLWAYRKNILYPPGASEHQDSDLDRALRDGDHKRADTILHHLVGQRSLPEVWRDAVRQQRVEILRALLLLGYVDNDPGFRLLQDAKDAIADPLLREVMKSAPYYSPKRDAEINFNSKVTVTVNGKNHEIVCGHFAEHWQAKHADRSGRDTIKSIYEEFTTAEAVAAQISVSSAPIMHMKARATEVRLIDNRRFGLFIVGQFSAMMENNQTNRQILMESTVHAMSVNLRIKRKNGHNVYVMKFYDPNRTATHIRSAFRDPAMFAALDFNRFFDADDMKEIYPEPKPVSIMYIRPPEQVLAASLDLPAIVPVDRMLTLAMNDEEIDGTIIWHLLAGGFAGNLRGLRDKIASRPNTMDTNLLAAKDDEGTSGLLMAMQDGYADAITAFCQLLELAPEKERIELLLGKDADTAIALAKALVFGHADCIAAFSKLLKLLPQKQRVKVLADAAIGLRRATGDMHITAIDQYITLWEATAKTADKADYKYLLKAIRDSHSRHWPLLGIRKNYRFYENWEKKNLEFYARFKKIKNALKT